jgi:hypothetical protein
LRRLISAVNTILSLYNSSRTISSLFDVSYTSDRELPASSWMTYVFPLVPLLVSAFGVVAV